MWLPAVMTVLPLCFTSLSSDIPIMSRVHLSHRGLCLERHPIVKSLLQQSLLSDQNHLHETDLVSSTGANARRKLFVARFINGRRRILQPMLDAPSQSPLSSSKPALKNPNSSLNTSSNIGGAAKSSAQRFWSSVNTVQCNSPGGATQSSCNNNSSSAAGDDSVDSQISSDVRLLISFFLLPLRH